MAFPPWPKTLENRRPGGRLAREGGQTAVYHLEEYETDRRHATLVAILLDIAATLTDEILNLHDRLIGSFFTKARHKYEKRFAAERKVVNDKVRLYAKVGAALIAAKEAGADPFQAIEAIVPWETFMASVHEAELLARDHRSEIPSWRASQTNSMPSKNWQPVVGVLTPSAGPADGAKVHPSLGEMMSEQPPLTTPRVQCFVNQAVALMQSQQPFFRRPVFWTFCMSGVRAPVRSGATSHPLP
jgi:hypothetical protein